MLEHMLDVVFPRRCAGCARGPWPLCHSCRSQVEPLRPPWCRRCGSPSFGDRGTCPDCPPAPIAMSRAAFRFHGPIRSAVHRLKFAGWRPVAQALGEAMAASWAQPDVDVVTWVPLSPRRRAERGFDQARVLAQVVGPRLGLPVVPLLAHDVGDRSTQARRDRVGRLAAMQGRFRACLPVRGTVLLVDDVLTTGATASACAAALVHGGAERVYVLTAARALTPRRRETSPQPRGAPVYSAPGSRPGLWLPGDPISGSRCQPRAKRPT
ncbi:MAG TPA: double zinc ribbon domain-containing protein [Actinomycetota bacterium]|nr:double zinc ribbon domain-containing protein [Actinomycetota bacterium]